MQLRRTLLGLCPHALPSGLFAPRGRNTNIRPAGEATLVAAGSGGSGSVSIDGISPTDGEG